MPACFRDRTDAGRRLADELARYAVDRGVRAGAAGAYHRPRRDAAGNERARSAAGSTAAGAADEHTVHVVAGPVTLG